MTTLKTTQTQSHIDELPLGGIVSVRDRLLEMQAKGKRILRLESGDPSFDLPVHIREAIEKALRDGHTHYTAGAGIPPLRKAVAEKLARENKIQVDPQHVLVTNGAMNGLYIAFRAIVAQPGDEVIVPDPTWTETADNVFLAGGVPVRCRLDEAHGYAYRPERIAELITERTRAIVVNSPHNPTGAVVDRRALEGILALAVKHDLVVVSDEAYEHVIFDGLPHESIGSFPGAQDRVLSIFSMSKSFAMSGLRVGYLAARDPKLLERMSKLLRCTINGVNSATQYGAVAALGGPKDVTMEMCRVYQARRDALFAGVSKVRHLKPFKPQGAFYLWARIDDAWPGYEGKKDGWAMTRFLIDTAGIGSAPGEVFGPAGAGHLRFAFSCPTDMVTDAAKALPTLFP